MDNNDFVCVRFMSRNRVYDFLKSLIDHDIYYKYEVSRNVISTGVVNIRFVIIPFDEKEIPYIRGMRFKKCFGFLTDEARLQLTGSMEKEDCSLLEYILKEIKSKLEVK